MSARGFLTLICAIGGGLMAGFFYTFSICVMRALAKIPPSQGIPAMQAINVVVINPLFLLVFLGTAVACALTLIGSLLRLHVPGSPQVLAGSVLYLAGTFLVTMLFNVPRNNALAALAPASPEAAAYWVNYLSTWTAWNHVRALAALAATVLFVLALRSR